MSRDYGLLTVLDNLEVRFAGPIDVRLLVQTKTDLTTVDFTTTGGVGGPYSGMVLGVTEDPVEFNNGMYMLIGNDSTDENNWHRLLFDADYEEQILSKPTINNVVLTGDHTPIEFFSTFLTAVIVDELPFIGDASTTTIYLVFDEEAQNYGEYMVKNTVIEGVERTEWEEIGRLPSFEEYYSIPEVDALATFNNESGDSTYTKFSYTPRGTAIDQMSVQDFVEDVFFKVIEPTIVNPSCTTSFNIYLIAAGEEIKTKVEVTYDRGSVTLDGVYQGEYGGEFLSEAFTTSTGTEQGDDGLTIIGSDSGDTITVQHFITVDEGTTVPLKSDGSQATASVSPGKTYTFTYLVEVIGWVFVGTDIDNGEFLRADQIDIENKTFQVEVSDASTLFIQWDASYYGYPYRVKAYNGVSGKLENLYGEPVNSQVAFNRSYSEENNTVTLEWNGELGGSKLIEIEYGQEIVDDYYVLTYDAATQITTVSLTDSFRTALNASPAEAYGAYNTGDMLPAIDDLTGNVSYNNLLKGITCDSLNVDNLFGSNMTYTVVSTNYMFANTNANISLDNCMLNTIETANYMFANATGDLLLDNISMTSLNASIGMFSGARYVQISGADFSAVLNCGDMFEGVTYVDASNSNFSAATNAASAFKGTGYADVTNCDFSSVTNAYYMFDNSGEIHVTGVKFTSLDDTGNFINEKDYELDFTDADFGSLIDISHLMVGTGVNLTNTDLHSVVIPFAIEPSYPCDMTNTDLSGLMDGSEMFAGTNDSLILSGTILTSVSDATGMFTGSSLDVVIGESIILSDALTFTTSMFADYTGTMDVSALDLSKVLLMNDMFLNYQGTSIATENFNTSSCQVMENMFSGCSNLTSLNVSSFDTSKVTNMSGMFEDCSGLETLDLSNFDITNVISSDDIFTGCNAVYVTCSFENFVFFASLGYTQETAIFDYPYFFTVIDDEDTQISTICLSDEVISNFDNDVYADIFLPPLPATQYDDISLSYLFVMRSASRIDCTNFDTTNVVDMNNLFTQNSSLTEIVISSFDTSNVTNMQGMFKDCPNLQAIDITHFDTALVTDMSFLFCGCESIAELDLSNLNTSKVTNMHSMFRDLPLASIDLSTLDTSNVTLMSYMFYGMSTITELDLSSFDTSNVTHMTSIFAYMTNLETVNVNELETDSLTNITYMFRDCLSLDELDMSEFRTATITSSDNVFYNCSDLTVYVSLIDYPFWYKKTDTPATVIFEVVDFYVTSGSTSLSIGITDLAVEYLESGAFDVPLPHLPVTSHETVSLARMFVDLQVSTLDLSEFDTSKVTNFGYMFAGSAITSIDLTMFDTSAARNIESMFLACPNLVSADISLFDTSNVTNMTAMFKDCTSYVTLDVSHFDFSNCTSLYWFLSSCTSLESVTFPTETITSISNFSRMFYLCQSLTEVNLDMFAPEGSADFSYMFYNCPALTTVYMNNMNFSDEFSSSVFEQMFSSCHGVIAYIHVSDYIDMISLGYADEDVFFWATGVYTMELVDGVAVYGLTEEGRTCIDLDGFYGRCLPPIPDAEVNVVSFDNFFDSSLATYINLSLWDVEGLVISMSAMFIDCENLLDLTLYPMNASTITTLQGCFSGCKNLLSLDLSNCDFSSVASLDNAFSDCEKIQSINLSNCDFSSVDSLAWTFKNCYLLTDMNMSNCIFAMVESMEGTFFNCTSMTSINLDGISLPLLTTMESAFENCFKITSVSFSGVGDNVVNFKNTFANCLYLTTIDLSQINDTYPETIEGMVTQCQRLEFLDISNFKSLSDVTNTNLFYNCSGVLCRCDTEAYVTLGPLYSLDVVRYEVTNFYTATVEDGITALALTEESKGYADENTFTELLVPHYMWIEDDTQLSLDYLFVGCEFNTAPNISTLIVDQVVSAAGFYAKCEAMVAADLSYFEITSVTDFSYFFKECYLLQDLTFISSGAITSLLSTFESCTSLPYFDLDEDIDCSGLTTTRLAFAYCTAMDYINLGPEMAPSDAGMMFYYSAALETIYMNNFYVTNIEDGGLAYMFNGCLETVVYCLTSAYPSLYNSERVHIGAINDTVFVVIDFYTISYANDTNTYGLSNDGKDLVMSEEIYTVPWPQFPPSEVAYYSMDYMFQSMDIVNIDISALDVSKVVSAKGLFKNCSLLETSGFSSMTFANVTDFSEVLYGCVSWSEDLTATSFMGSLTTIENGFVMCNGFTFNFRGADLSDIDFTGAFTDADYIKGYFDDLDMYLLIDSLGYHHSVLQLHMDNFYYINGTVTTLYDTAIEYVEADFFINNRLPAPNWDITSLYATFKNIICTSLDLTRYEFGTSLNLQSAFYGIEVDTLNLKGWQPGGNTSFYYAFGYATIGEINLTDCSFTASNLYCTFRSTTIDSGLDLTCIDIQSNVTMGGFMWELTCQDVTFGDWDMRYITALSSAFLNSDINITTIDWTLRDCITIYSAFSYSNFESITLRGSTDASLTQATYAFNGCSNLTVLDLSEFYIPADTSTNYAFASTPLLENVQINLMYSTSSGRFGTPGITTRRYFAEMANYEIHNATLTSLTSVGNIEAADVYLIEADEDDPTIGHVSLTAEGKAWLNSNSLTGNWIPALPIVDYTSFNLDYLFEDCTMSGISFFRWNYDIPVASAKGMFKNCTNLSSITDFEYLDFSATTDISEMFYNTRLTSIPDINLDYTIIENADYFLYGSTAISGEELDFSENTVLVSAVDAFEGTSMSVTILASQMILFEVIDYLNTNVEFIIKDFYILTDLEDQDCTWIQLNPYVKEYIHSDAYIATGETYVLPEMPEVYTSYISYESLFEDFQGHFSYNNIYDDTSIIDFSCMFAGWTDETLYLERFTFTDADCSYMFEDCTSMNIYCTDTSYTTLDDLGYAVGDVQIYVSGFYNNGSVITNECFLNGDYVNNRMPAITPNITSFLCEFDGISVATIDISRFDFSNLTSMGYLFRYCSSNLIGEPYNTNASKVTNVDYMFYYFSGTVGATTLNNLSLNASNFLYTFAHTSLSNYDFFNTWTSAKTVNYLYGAFAWVTSSNADVSFDSFTVSSENTTINYICKQSTLNSFTLNGVSTTNATQAFYQAKIGTVSMNNFTTSESCGNSSMFSYCVIGTLNMYDSEWKEAWTTSGSNPFSSANIGTCNMARAKMSSSQYYMFKSAEITNLDLSYSTFSATSCYMFYGANITNLSCYGSTISVTCPYLFDTLTVDYLDLAYITIPTKCEYIFDDMVADYIDMSHSTFSGEAIFRGNGTCRVFDLHDATYNSGYQLAYNMKVSERLILTGLSITNTIISSLFYLCTAPMIELEEDLTFPNITSANQVFQSMEYLTTMCDKKIFTPKCLSFSNMWNSVGSSATNPIKYIYLMSDLLDTKNLGSTFYGSAFETIDLSDMYVPSDSTVTYMCYNCTNLKTIYMQQFYATSTTTFSYCSGVRGVTTMANYPTVSNYWLPATYLSTINFECEDFYTITPIEGTNYATISISDENKTWFNNASITNSYLPALPQDLEYEGYDCEYLFANLNLTTTSFDRWTETVNVIGAKGMFYGQSSFTSIPSLFTFSGLTDVTEMFYGCAALTELPEIDYTDVTVFDRFLNGAATNANYSIDLTGTNVVSAIDAFDGSYGTVKISIADLVDIEYYDYIGTNVTIEVEGFYEYEVDATNDVTAVTLTEGAAEWLTSDQVAEYSVPFPIPDLETITTTSVSYATIFDNLQGNYTFDVLQNYTCVDFTRMFAGWQDIEIDLTVYTVGGNVVTEMFDGCDNVSVTCLYDAYIQLDNLGNTVSALQITVPEFYTASYYPYLDESFLYELRNNRLPALESHTGALDYLLAGRGTSSIYGVYGVDLERWDTSNITSMVSLCYNSTFTYLSNVNFNTSNTTAINNMFENTVVTTSPILNNWNCQNITGIVSLFKNSSFTDFSFLETWTNTGNIVIGTSAFYGCIAPNSDIDLSDFGVFTSATEMFYNTSFNSVTMTVYGQCNYLFRDASIGEINIPNSTFTSGFYGAFYGTQANSLDMTNVTFAGAMSGNTFTTSAVIGTVDISNSTFSNQSWGWSTTNQLFRQMEVESFIVHNCSFSAALTYFFDGCDITNLSFEDCTFSASLANMFVQGTYDEIDFHDCTFDSSSALSSMFTAGTYGTIDFDGCSITAFMRSMFVAGEYTRINFTNSSIVKNGNWANSDGNQLVGDSVTSIGTIDLSNSSITYASYMFYRYSSSYYQNINKLIVSGLYTGSNSYFMKYCYVTTIESDGDWVLPSGSCRNLLGYCPNLVSIPNISFNGDVAASAYGMFDHCTSLPKVKISGTGYFSSISYMFYGDKALVEIDFSDFTFTGTASNYTAPFYGNSALEDFYMQTFETVGFVGTYFSGARAFCGSVPQYNIQHTYYNVASYISNMNYELDGFYSAIESDGLADLDLYISVANKMEFVTEGVTYDTLPALPKYSLDYDLTYCLNETFKDLNLSEKSWERMNYDSPTIKVVQAISAFEDLSDITTLPTCFDFSECTDFQSAFKGCTNLIETPADEINWDNVTNIDYIFNGVANTVPYDIDLTNNTVLTSGTEAFVGSYGTIRVSIEQLVSLNCGQYVGTDVTVICEDFYDVTVLTDSVSLISIKDEGKTFLASLSSAGGEWKLPEMPEVTTTYVSYNSLYKDLMGNYEITLTYTDNVVDFSYMFRSWTNRELIELSDVYITATADGFPTTTTGMFENVYLLGVSCRWDDYIPLDSLGYGVDMLQLYVPNFYVGGTPVSTSFVTALANYRLPGIHPETTDMSFQFSEYSSAYSINIARWSFEYVENINSLFYGSEITLVDYCDNQDWSNVTSAQYAFGNSVLTYEDEFFEDLVFGTIDATSMFHNTSYDLSFTSTWTIGSMNANSFAYYASNASSAIVLNPTTELSDIRYAFYNATANTIEIQKVNGLGSQTFRATVANSVTIKNSNITTAPIVETITTSAYMFYRAYIAETITIDSCTITDFNYWFYYLNYSLRDSSFTTIINISNTTITGSDSSQDCYLAFQLSRGGEINFSNVTFNILAAYLFAGTWITKLNMEYCHFLQSAENLFNGTAFTEASIYNSDFVSGDQFDTEGEGLIENLIISNTTFGTDGPLFKDWLSYGSISLTNITFTSGYDGEVGMFNGALYLTSLSISGDFALKGTNLDYCFYNLSSLTSFTGADNITTENGTTFNYYASGKASRYITKIYSSGIVTSLNGAFTSSTASSFDFGDTYISASASLDSTFYKCYYISELTMRQTYAPLTYSTIDYDGTNQIKIWLSTDNYDTQNNAVPVTDSGFEQYGLEIDGFYDYTTNSDGLTVILGIDEADRDWYNGLTGVPALPKPPDNLDTSYDYRTTDLFEGMTLGEYAFGRWGDLI